MLGLKLLHVSKTIWFHDKYITMSMLFVWRKPKIRTTYTKGNTYISYISLLRCYIWWLEIKAKPLTVRCQHQGTFHDTWRSPQINFCDFRESWWRHQMETFSALLAHFAVTGEFPSQRPVTRSFDVFLLSVPEQAVEYTVETSAIWDAIALIMTSI